MASLEGAMYITLQQSVHFRWSNFPDLDPEILCNSLKILVLDKIIYRAIRTRVTL